MDSSIAGKAWSQLDSKERKSILVVGTAQVALMGAALWDLYHHPANRVRGSKKLWAPVCLVNFIGPITYFLVGRKR